MSKLFLVTLITTLLSVMPNDKNKATDRIEHAIGGDYFTAGKSATITQPIAGDVIAAGKTVDLNAAVGGDAVLAGESVRATNDISQNLYAAGRVVSVSGSISRNARLAGEEVETSPESQVLGNVSVAAKRANINGSIQGYFQAIAERVYINAPVNGDVEVTSGELELGPAALIRGHLRYDTREEIKQDPGARILGSIERAVPSESWTAFSHSNSRAGLWIWTIGLMFLAAVLVAALPRFYSGLEHTLCVKLPLTVLAGIASMIGIPVAAVFMLITLIGIPLGLLTIAAFLTLVLVGYASTSVVLGDWMLHQFRPLWSTSLVWRSMFAAAAVLLIGVLGAIPWFGGLLFIAATFVGMGAILMHLLRPAPVGEASIS